MKSFNFKPATTATKNAKQAEENRLKHYSHQQEMNNLKKVYSLPPDFRYSAAKDFGLLKWYKHKHNGLSYHDGSLWGNEELRKEFVSELGRIAFRKTDFGRKQNYHSGTRTLNCPESFKTTSHPAGQWTSYDYWADFSVFFNRKKPEILFSYDNKVFKIDVAETPLSLSKYKHITQAEPFKPLFESGVVTFDPKEIAVTMEGETYHIEEKEIYLTEIQAQNLFNRVHGALVGRVFHKNKAKILKNLPDDLEISVAHSLAAGNCIVGTEQFRKRYGLMEKEAYTVAELRAKGVDFDNTMFQRAIYQATL